MHLLLLYLGTLAACVCVGAEYTHYRLPAAVQPELYNLRVLTHLKDAENLHFEGDVKITLRILEATDNIILHAKNLSIDTSKVRLQDAAKQAAACVKSANMGTDNDYFIIKTCEQLPKGGTYELSIPFAAELNRQLEGYYRSSYKDSKTNQTKWISITQFEPATARNAFPCFDEPDFKASFIVTLGHHKDYTALSNMPLKATQPHGELADYMWSEFEKSVPMSTYLVAYSINDFAHKQSASSELKNHVQFRTWARPNAIDQCDYAAEFGPAVLQYYEEFFGIKFPLPKMDQIAIPDFAAGAMENWGLVTYRETTLLYAENSSSFADKQRVATVVAHELAHQWFGNLVTMKWWTDLWLNEGFATYVSSLGIEHVNPNWHALEEESLLNLLTIFRVDALESSHPISRPIEKVTEIRESFDAISYNKGSSVLRMMHKFLGEESFRTGLNEYLKMYSYNNAEQDNLWTSLTQAAHKNRAIPKNYDIKSIMDSWTLQTGYPILNITRNYEAGTAKITQERYLLSTQASRKQKNDCWWVPLSYTTQKESNFNATAPKEWFECGTDETHPIKSKTIKNLPGKDEWLIFNMQLTTLYKVNYDEHNWKLIIEALTQGDFQQIHVLNRAQLIDDALNLAWSGDQNYEIAMRLIEYLQREREYLPWKAASENLNRLSRIIRQTPEFEYFKRYMQKILTPIYMHLNGLNDTFGDLAEQNDVLLKTLIAGWACRFNVEDCVPKALSYFAEWRKLDNPDERNLVPINLRSTIYCTAVRHGNDDDWKFLWTRYKNSNVAAEKKTILTALGCTREVWLLQSFLERTFDDTGIIRKQDSMFAFQAVALNEIGFHLAKNYFMSNVDALSRFYYPTTNHLGRLLTPLSKQIITESDYKELKTFIAQNKKSLHGIDQAIQQALETVLTNVQWKERNYGEMSRAIHNLLD